MGLLGDTYVGTFELSAIELVRTNVDKVVSIRVDGVEIASESVILPHTWEQEKAFQTKDGAMHRMVVHAMLKKLFGILPYDSEYAIDVDGQPLRLQKTR